MNIPCSSREKVSEAMAIMDAGCDPIYFSVTVTIFDARKNPPNPLKARRVQTFPATPESLAGLPNRLNAMVRATGEEAQMDLNNLLAVLAQPEPPAAAPEVSNPVLQPPVPIVDSAPSPASAVSSGANEEIAAASPNILVGNNNNQ